MAIDAAIEAAQFRRQAPLKRAAPAPRFGSARYDDAVLGYRPSRFCVGRLTADGPGLGAGARRGYGELIRRGRDDM